MGRYIEDKKFDNLNYTEKPLRKGEYEYCTFTDCDFSNSDLAQIVFLECEFISCNLSMVKLTETALRNTKFKECKMLGINFGSCNKFGFKVSFEDCILNYCIFHNTKLKNTKFVGSQLHEADFSVSDLTNSTFDNCDLARASFDNTILKNVDFRTAYNFEINPEINRINKAKFSIHNLSGLLTKYDIEIER